MDTLVKKGVQLYVNPVLEMLLYIDIAEPDIHYHKPIRLIFSTGAYVDIIGDASKNLTGPRKLKIA